MVEVRQSAAAVHRVKKWNYRYQDTKDESGDLKNCFNIFSFAIQSQVWFKSLNRLKKVSPSTYISVVYTLL